jgi:Ca-activated chloride channel family protein
LGAVFTPALRQKKMREAFAHADSLVTIGTLTAMSDSNHSRRRNVIIILALILALLALLLFRCSCRAPKTPAATPTAVKSAPIAAPISTAVPAAAPGDKQPDEVLTPATIKVPTTVQAGAAFPVEWTGPNNRDDFITIVPKDALENAYKDYRLTREGSPLPLTASMDPGEYEVRYVTGRSHKVLGRAAIRVEPVAATLNAPDAAALGSIISVTWTGPNNAGDYVTVVAKNIPDGQYGNYTGTAEGSPLNLTLPPMAGDAELRYMSGQGNRVLGRRTIKITTPDVTLSAADEAIAGSTLTIGWTGPGNSGDYITIVAKEKPEGQYGNYGTLSKAASVAVLVPIEPGEMELRYVTGQGAKVLRRRALRVVAAQITLNAPAEAIAGLPVTIDWTGPNYGGDYLTIVSKNTPDGQYAAYANTSGHSPSKIAAPKVLGEAEVRYMSGQGAKVLARRLITVVTKQP